MSYSIRFVGGTWDGQIKPVSELYPSYVVPVRRSRTELDDAREWTGAGDVQSFRYEKQIYRLKIAKDLAGSAFEHYYEIEPA